MKKIFHLQIPRTFLQGPDKEEKRERLLNEMSNLITVGASLSIMLSTFDELYPENNFIITPFDVPVGSVVLLDNHPIGERLQIITPTRSPDVEDNFPNLPKMENPPPPPPPRIVHEHTSAEQEEDESPFRPKSPGGIVPRQSSQLK